jgi:hypothetical protein
MIFSCSLSPVVVLVSRLFCGRRFERSEGAAHGATDDARATRAARAYTTGGSRRRSRAGAFARCVGLLLFLFSSCLSLRACHSTLAPPAPAGGALTTSARAAHAAHGATRAAHGESERRALSEHAVRVRGFAANGRPPGLCSARSFYLFKRKGKFYGMPRRGVARFVVAWAFFSKCPRPVLGGDDDDEPMNQTQTRQAPSQTTQTQQRKTQSPWPAVGAEAPSQQARGGGGGVEVCVTWWF